MQAYRQLISAHFSSGIAACLIMRSRLTTDRCVDHLRIRAHNRMMDSQSSAQLLAAAGRLRVRMALA